MSTKMIAAGRFKQTCLALLDEVAALHEEVVITKRGKPVARLLPVTDARDREASVLAILRAAGGRVLVSEAELLKPTAELAGWRDAGE
jgi:prevent-host-death family protein